MSKMISSWPEDTEKEGVVPPPSSCVSFTVRGLPQAQGSSRAFVVKGKPVITSTNKNLAGWKRLIADVAQHYAPEELITQAVSIHLLFMLPRPKTLPKKYKRHVRKPDLDKLIRSVLDALTSVIWKDDSQVVKIVAEKIYFQTPGVTILVVREEEE